MHIHTLYLNTLLLALCVYPVGLSSALSHLLQRLNPKNMMTAQMTLLLTGFLVIIGTVSLFKPNAFLTLTVLPGFIQLGWIPPIAVGSVLLEYLTNVVFTFFKSRKWIFAPTVHSDWSHGVSIWAIILLVGIAWAEEVLFRGFMLPHLITAFGVSVSASLVLTSFFYGLNHLYFGMPSVLNKMISGLIYGASYLVSGSLWFPVMIHALHNLLIVSLGRFSVE